MSIAPGDIVGRKSHGSDILFRVCSVSEGDGGPVAHLKGLDVRLLADAPLNDLEKKDPAAILEHRHKEIEKSNRQMRSILAERTVKRNSGELFRRAMSEDTEGDGSFFEVPGRVIHIDGDQDYMEKCLRNYAMLEIEAKGFFVPESDQPDRIAEILGENTAEILVLTGHDGLAKGTKDFKDLSNYHNSKYFVEAVRIARKVDPSRDGLAIFAGACQSHYEAILDAGANFASSPLRVLIHAYDPVYVVEKLAFTPFGETLSIKDLIANTITGSEGIGGVETRGRFRIGYPKSPY